MKIPPLDPPRNPYFGFAGLSLSLAILMFVSAMFLADTMLARIGSNLMFAAIVIGFRGMFTDKYEDGPPSSSSGGDNGYVTV